MRFPKLLLGILCSESAFFLGHYIAISLNFPGILLLFPLCHAFYQGSNLKILLSPQNFMLKLKDVFKEMNRKIASTEQLVFLSYENKTKYSEQINKQNIRKIKKDIKTFFLD